MKHFSFIFLRGR